MTTPTTMFPLIRWPLQQCCPQRSMRCQHIEFSLSSSPAALGRSCAQVRESSPRAFSVGLVLPPSPAGWLLLARPSPSDVARSGDSHILSSLQDFSCRRLGALPFHSLCETFAWSGFVRSAGMTFPARTSVNFQLNWSTLCFQRQTTQALVTPAIKPLLQGHNISACRGALQGAAPLWAVTEGLTCNFVLGVFSRWVRSGCALPCVRVALVCRPAVSLAGRARHQRVGVKLWSSVIKASS